MNMKSQTFKTEKRNYNKEKNSGLTSSLRKKYIYR